MPAGSASSVEYLLRELAPQILGALVRRGNDFDSAEDGVQEALLSAATEWPVSGRPHNPRGWLLTVASRRLVDQQRRDVARRRREAAAATLALPHELTSPAADEDVQAADDTLLLLFLCCHPALTAESQVALTLRAVGGLTTAQIARAFLVPAETMGRRIGRAKRRIADEGATFGPLTAHERDERLGAVLRVLYLIFNEGYTATAGTALHRAELTREAIRLTRQIHRLLPQDGEIAGLLALMLITEARSAARTTPDGALVPLTEQDRSQWNTGQISEGTGLITRTLPRSLLGPYQVQAAIAAVHAEAERAEHTDWPQVVALYELLDRIAPGPVVTLNRAVAVAMVKGPYAGLALLTDLESDHRLAGHHRLPAVRAHLLEMHGDRDAAHASYLTAACRTTSLPEQRYLEARAARLVDTPEGGRGESRSETGFTRVARPGTDDVR